MLLAIRDAASTATYDKITVLVAYATKFGCEILVNALRAAFLNWNDIDKTWIISLDFGHTQPDALEYLAKLPKSAVAIPNAHLVLKAKLRPPMRFHPKLYFLECADDPEKTAVVSGSCNLTRAGLYLNTEQMTVSTLRPPIIKDDRQTAANLVVVRTLIQEVCSSAVPLDQKILTSYRSLWKPDYLPPVEKGSSAKVVARDPSIDMDKAMALSTTSNFWLKITRRVVQNLGPNRPGNQIDMQRGARVFFGFDVTNVEPNTVLGPVSIRFQGNITSQSLRYGNNGMDKITLPPLDPPRTYANQTLLFRRQPDDIFDLVIGTQRQASIWRNLSIRQNVFYQMQSGREFGVFE